MTKPAIVSATAILFLLAAIEVAAPAPPGGTTGAPSFRLATFIPACEPVPPHVQSVYLGRGKPVPRGRFTAVDVFMRGHHPALRYQVIGEVTVSSTSRNVSLWNLIDTAKAEARRLGGEALIDVDPHPQSPDNPRGERVLTATVVNWS